MATDEGFARSAIMNRLPIVSRRVSAYADGYALSAVCRELVVFDRPC